MVLALQAQPATRNADVRVIRCGTKRNNSMTTTLKDLIISKKCRKGPADGTTKRGAYWEVFDAPTCIRSFGGDGVGQNRSDRRNKLEFRHYRNGDVSAVVRFQSWHQNSGSSVDYQRVDSILGCATIEGVIISLKGESRDGSPILSDHFIPELTSLLQSIGLPVAEASPDEIALSR